jgi:ubiquinol-cytochrome c reductase cytochrome c1 subunit
MKNILISGILAIALTGESFSHSHTAVSPPKQNWSFNGPFGSFKRDELQRGFQVYKEVCSACHSLKRVHFRNLKDLGFNEAEIKAIAAGYKVKDGPNQDGEMFERNGLPSDHFVSPFPNDNAAKAANNGALPPDLSLIVKARVHGADYIHGILVGYQKAPEGVQVGDNQHYNLYMPGNLIAMAPPFVSDGQVTYADCTKATIEQMAHDVTVFLAWCAEPEMETRKKDGINVILYLLFMTVLFYVVKRRIWKNVH